MKLNEQGLSDRKPWEEKGYRLPKYDREKMVARTKETPFWIHFGAGNLFKAFHSNVIQNLLNEGELNRGLIAVAGYENVEKMNRPHDDYNILVTLKADGSVEKTVVGSVAESLAMDAPDGKDFGRLQEIFSNDSLQMATFTITEKGYSLTDANGDFLPDVKKDFSEGPKKPRTYMGKITSLLYTRYLAGARPIAMVSTDNCSHNGDKLYAAVHTFAQRWAKVGKAAAGFLSYIENKEKVSFPWTMIDKITPRPDSSVEKILLEDGVEDLDPVVTSRHTYLAPFVNAEECEYLVVEDAFPNGRPRLEKGGIIFTDRETVDKVETMKVCTCLNPLHTTLGIFGCLLGYGRISEEMKDEQIRRLVERVGYQEGLPAVVDPGILDPREFIDTVLNVRIPNPFMPDTPQRIAMDTSQKLAIRFGETIKAYQSSPELDVKELKGIPLVFAGWLRYLLAVDDEGNAFEPSSDPLLSSLQSRLSGISLGQKADAEPILRPILESEAIFGVNLYEAGLAGLVCQYFTEMVSGTGAVRKVLEKYV